MTRQTFEEAMGRLLIIWPHRAPTPATATDLYRVYWEALSDLPDAPFVAAVHQAMQSCQYFPVPAELHAFADAVIEADRDELIRRRLAAEGERVMAFPGPAQLPERALSPEEEAERDRRWAENRDRVKAEIAAATARMGSPSSAAPRRPAAAISEQARAEAEAWLASLREKGAS